MKREEKRELKKKKQIRSIESLIEVNAFLLPTLSIILFVIGYRVQFQHRINSI